MKPEARHKLLDLILHQRWAALATVEDDTPLASWAAFVFDREAGHFYLHLSTLARHTQNLQANPRVSLSISEADRGTDPQELARVSIQGKLEALDKGGDEYARAKPLYLQRLPDAGQLFDFGDFRLFRLAPVEVRYVAGFAQAFTFDHTRFAALLAD